MSDLYFQINILFLLEIKIVMRTVIKIKWIEVLFWLTFAVCCWIIFSVGFNVLPLINCNLNEWFILKSNLVLLNLSYSYIAGCIFYFLSVALPRYKEQKQIKPAIRMKFKNIERSISDAILEFSRETPYEGNYNIKDIDVCRDILDSKIWTDNAPFIYEIYGINISYLLVINDKKNAISKEIDEIIIGYKTSITSEQLVTLEKIRNAQIFHFVSMWSQFPYKNLDNPDGKKHMYRYVL